MRENEIAERVERFKKISLFKDILYDDNSLTDIAKLFKTITIIAGKPVIQEGEDGSSLYIIRSGTVKIQKKTRNADEYTVAELSADMNIFFGELAILDPDKRSATVLCKTNCEFYVLDRQQFIEFGNINPKAGLFITREISRILCQRLRKANTDMLILFDALVEEVEISGGLS